MNREKLKEIEARWVDYLAKSDAERKALFEQWWDKRDFWDLCEAVDKALGGEDLESGQPTMLRLAAEALASVTKDRMIEEWVRKYNESQAEVRDLTLKLKEIEKFLAAHNGTGEPAGPPMSVSEGLRIWSQARVRASEERAKQEAERAAARKFESGVDRLARGECSCEGGRDTGPRCLTCLARSVQAEMRR